MRRLSAASALLVVSLLAPHAGAEDEEAVPLPDSEEAELPPFVEVGGEPFEEEGEGDEEPPHEHWDVSIWGDRRRIDRLAGSAHRIEEEQLARFEDDDAERVITREVPGAYVRAEDGYGLRPNIGMRGGNSDRSKKITLLEDGILFGPAPYSAPAAYYFPLMTRMVGVEAFKGPATIQHGPNNIGGAINLLTRKIPYGHRFGADLALGTQLYGKGHAHYGYGADHWGILIEGVRLRSDGFKELDGGGETGFDKMELMLKARVNTSPIGAVYNEGNIKLGYGREVSHETYLGLSEGDFRAAPLRRYRASALDRMDWDRFQVEVGHGLVVRDLVTIRTVLYRHDFHRAWYKLNRFAAGPELYDILQNPSESPDYFDVISGAADSVTPGQALLVGTNDRTFVAQGVQSDSTWQLPKLWVIEQTIRFGLRAHYDEIDRLHSEDSHQMRGGRLVRDDTPRQIVTDNFARAMAFAGYLGDDIALWRFLVTPGIRFEHIRTHFEDSLSGAVIEGVQNVVLPGVGVLYQAVDEVGLLAGVHQGFSPVAPGQGSEVRPEVSLNYEAGARLTTEVVSLEAIGFFSDYSNITGECTFSSGCREELLDQQFNGGEAHVYGAEVSGRAEIPTPINLRIPLTVAYTFTQTELLTAFTSENPQLGDVRPGDELPYVPKHQLAGTASLVADGWGGFSVGATWIDNMREIAGQGEVAPEEETDSAFYIDLAAYGHLLPEVQIYGKVSNLLDNRYIASRRPFGARPGAPRIAFVGVKVLIDRE